MSFWRLSRVVTCAALGLAVAAVPLSYTQPVFAQEAESEQKDAKLPKVEEVTKNMESVDGLFKLFRHAEDDATKDPSKMLALIPRSLLETDLMLAVSIPRGPSYGFPVTGDLVKFQASGNRVLLIAPDTRIKQDKSKTVDGAVAGTYTPRYLASMPVLAKTPQGDLLVDMTQFLVGGTLRFSRAMGPMMRPDDIVARYQTVKAFPDNMLIEVKVALPSPAGGSSSHVSYSFRRLPAMGSYTPRVADERVGYFTTVRQDWSTKYDSREILQRYVNRWNLKKLDPSLELSPPEKPIVFIIEKTVPLQWRRYVAEGILDWNKSFEKIGISGAIVVQQQTDDNEFADIDPEDARYNFFRWIVTGGGFAMGPSRPDPRTGEILDADIVFDDSMVRYSTQNLSNFASPEGMAWQFGPEFMMDPALAAAVSPFGSALDGQGQRHVGNNLSSLARDMTLLGRRNSGAGPQANYPMAQGTGGQVELLQSSGASAAAGAQGGVNLRELLSPASCGYAQGVRQNVAMLRLLYAASTANPGGKVPDKLIGQIVRNVSAHEVGHTLGLRHNFKASAWMSVEEIKTKRDTTDEATIGSVMDYDALLLYPGDKLDKLKNIVSPTVGPYDHWAIEYGYKEVKDDAELGKIASRTNEPGLAYATDEDVMGATSIDPQANRWDMGASSVDWAKTQIQLADELLATFDKWAVKPDEPQQFLVDSFYSLMFHKTRSLFYVARTIGGQEFNRNRASDPNATPPITLVSAEEQRQAMKLLTETILSDGFLSAKPELLNKLVPTRHWDEGFDDMPPARVDFPIHQTILSLQSGTVSYLTSTAVLQRVYDAQVKTTEANPFTAAELLTGVRTALFAELALSGRYTDAKPMISAVRRNLQKRYVENMLTFVRSTPGQTTSPDLHSMARFTLRELAGQMGSSLDRVKEMDFATKAHLSESKALIEQALNNPEPKAAGGMPMIIIMGEEQNGANR